MNKKQIEMIKLIIDDLESINPSIFKEDDKYFFKLAIGNLNDLIKKQEKN
jgi:hypothetical protein